jgi:hypothetical protein
MTILEGMGFRDRNLGEFFKLERSQVPLLDRGGSLPHNPHDLGSIRGSRNPEKPWQGQVMDFWEETAKIAFTKRKQRWGK